MPNGSIPHGKQRSNSVKRHASPSEHPQKLDETRNTATLSETERDEIIAQMDETLRDILTLTRRYIRMDKRMRTVVGKYVDPTLAQLEIMWIVNRATWSDDLEKLYEMQAKIEGESPL